MYLRYTQAIFRRFPGGARRYPIGKSTESVVISALASLDEGSDGRLDVCGEASTLMRSLMTLGVSERREKSSVLMLIFIK